VYIIEYLLFHYSLQEKFTRNLISLEKTRHYGVVILEVLMMVGINGMVLWDVITCGLVVRCRHCEETSKIWDECEYLGILGWRQRFLKNVDMFQISSHHIPEDHNLDNSRASVFWPFMQAVYCVVNLKVVIYICNSSCKITEASIKLCLHYTFIPIVQKH
jgi:hypothetical protein